ncbi:MAG: aldehyde dehydrogenase [Rhodospirillales bacterium]|nr:aldehyde dehydrogenase [Rhodospirillales bacterium]
MHMLIDGEWVDSQGGGVDAIVERATGIEIDTVPSGDESDVSRAVAAAQQGKRRIAAMPSHERSAILLRAADRIAADHERLSRLLARENGKTLREIRSEMNAAIRIFRGYAEEGKRLLGRATPLDSIPGQDRSLALTLRQPRGVVAAIIPFNYPAELWAHKVAGALAAGNAVITKPPEECPLTIIEIARLLEESGLPRAAHQVVTGVGEVVGAALVRASGVDMVTMTGSTAAGRRILRDAAETMKKVHLELGGNDATIVCDDADPAAVADALVSGRFTSGNGQICCAVKRVLVDRRIHDEITSAVVERTGKLKLGDPLDAGTDVGPLITEAAARRVEEQVRQAVAQGARIAIGGARSGAFFEPTVLLDVRPDTAVFDEEIFGPVLPLIPFDSFDEALDLANRGPYGLQAAIFTNDVRRIMRAYRELDVGTVVVNHSTAIRLENLPFGGTKLSGNAREGLHETLLDMTEQKTLLMSDVFPK